MKKTIILVSIVSVCVVFLWLMFFFFPNITLWGEKEFLRGCQNDVRFHLSIAYVAAGALFTAIAFIGTLWINLKIHKNAVRASSLNAFLNVFEKIQNEKKFNDARKYVLNTLPKDLETIRTNNPEITEIGTRELKTMGKPKDKSNAKNEVITTGYNHVIYFCGKMEYLGLLLKNKYIEDESLLDYFGNIIIDSYKNVKDILAVDKKRNQNKTHSIHYAYLYYAALKRKPNFEKECKEYMSHRKNQMYANV
jgi:hypothetical protein